MPLNPEQLARFSEVAAAIGLKGELEKTARRHLRSTPEYQEARAAGVARSWLHAEGDSMAEYLYEALTTRELERPSD